MFSKLALAFVLFFTALSLSACFEPGNNILETAKNTARATFEADGPGGMTRPEAAAMWSLEVGKLQMCESTSTINNVVYIKSLDGGKSFAFSMVANNDKPECGMVRPWSPVLNSLLKSGAYSTNVEAGKAAIASR
jgi:hypothetical protein